MRASYDLTVDDLAAFVMFHHAKSPAARRQTTGCLTAAVALMLAIPTILLIFNRSSFQQAIGEIWPLFLFPVAFLALTIPFVKWRTAQMSQQLLREGQNTGFYGPHSLRLDEDGLHETKDAGETYRKWSAVERLIVTSTHLFIYTSGVEAFVVPLHAFSVDDSAEGFCQFISAQSGIEPQQV